MEEEWQRVYPYITCTNLYSPITHNLLTNKAPADGVPGMKLVVNTENPNFKSTVRNGMRMTFKKPLAGTGGVYFIIPSRGEANLLYTRGNTCSVIIDFELETEEGSSGGGEGERTCLSFVKQNYGGATISPRLVTDLQMPTDGEHRLRVIFQFNGERTIMLAWFNEDRDNGIRVELEDGEYFAGFEFGHYQTRIYPSGGVIIFKDFYVECDLPTDYQPDNRYATTSSHRWIRMGPITEEQWTMDSHYS